MTLPVVFLASHADPAYERLAFERGALDFIDKTRGVEMLAERLRPVTKSGKPAAAPATGKPIPIVCGKLVLRPAGHRAYWNEVEVELTVGEYNIVHLLVSNVGNDETYRAIYDAQYCEGLRKGIQGYRTNVRSSVRRIRRKFCEVDFDFQRNPELADPRISLARLPQGLLNRRQLV